MAKILLVDDDVDMCRMAKQWLSRQEHEVTVAYEGLSGLEEITGKNFDLAILDWDLPNLTGIDLLQKFRDAGGTIPIILLTGRSSIDDKESGLDCGADDYLTKPFHLKELSARIRSLLRKSSSALPKPLGSCNQDVLKSGNLVGSALAARYEFQDLLYQDQTTLVFKARIPSLDKPVAIKMLPSTQMAEEDIQCFERLARDVSRLEHSNLVAIHDFGITERKQPYVVMEYIEGETLQSELNRRELLPLSEGLRLMYQVVDAVCHIRQSGIPYSGISPCNLMIKTGVDGMPKVKILEFILAGLEEGCKSITLEVPGADQDPLKGDNRQSNSRHSETFSLACLIFQAITGRLPYPVSTELEITPGHPVLPPLSAKDARPEVDYPPELENLLSRALQEDGTRGYESLLEFRNDLSLLMQKLCPDTGKGARPVEEVIIENLIARGYRVLSVIGGGGYGLIYKAEQESLKRIVALKILFPHFTISGKFVKRFEQEAKAISRLNHSNVVAIYDYSSSEDLPFLVMEYIEGPTLAQVIIDRGALSVEHSLPIFMQICDGLSHAHRAGVIHRDLKPSNIILSTRQDGVEQTKIVDFGIAKPMSQDEDYRKLTLTGEVFGSPPYMSPEQCMGLKIDLRTDIYSMGCLMYETLSGLPAFSGSNPLEIIQKQIAEIPPDLQLAAVNPAVAEFLRSIVLKTLSKKPDRRYQTMNELREDLSKVVDLMNRAI